MANQKDKAITIDINGKTFYTKFGAAERLKMSEATLKRESNAKRITSMKHSSGLVYLPEWIDEYLEKKISYAKKVIKAK